MIGAEFWVLGCLAAVLVGLSKGGLPVVGMLAVPVLALAISPVAAAGLLLPVYVASDLIGLYAYRRAFDRRVLSILAPAAVLGVGFGWMTAASVPDRLVAGIVGPHPTNAPSPNVTARAATTARRAGRPLELSRVIDSNRSAVTASLGRSAIPPRVMHRHTPRPGAR